VRVRRAVVPVVLSLAAIASVASVAFLVGHTGRDRPERVRSSPEPSLPVPENLPGPILKVWAAENESRTHDATRARALGDARRLQAISAIRVTYRDEIEAMRAVNPDLRVFSYMMGTFAWRSQPPGTYPESWYLKDERGSYVRSIGEWSGQYLMDPSRPGWVRDRVRTCRRFLDESGYDGCMVDVLGLAPLNPSFISAVPIDRRTGTFWEPEDWLEATAALATTVKHAVRPALVIANGLSSGGAYFSPVAPTSRLLRGIDGAIAEAWLRGARSDPGRFPEVAAWRANVDMLVDAALRGKIVMTLTKVWAGADRATTRHWYRFALASFLLGTNGGSYFGFSGGREEPPTRPLRTELHLGAPLDRYRRSGQAFLRRFARGIVVVNPTAARVDVALPGAFLTLDGGRVDGRIELPPHTGEILQAAG
jgi:hypothetical protein